MTSQSIGHGDSMSNGTNTCTGPDKPWARPSGQMHWWDLV